MTKKNRIPEPEFSVRHYVSTVKEGEVVDTASLTREELLNEVCRCYDLLGNVMDALDASALLSAAVAIKQFMQLGEEEAK